MEVETPVRHSQLLKWVRECALCSVLACPVVYSAEVVAAVPTITVG